MKDKIKQKLTLQAGKWTDKVALAAAIGLTGVAIWAAYKTYDTVKNWSFDFDTDDIDWDGK